LLKEKAKKDAPRIPFSDCMWMTVPGSRKDGASIGIPIPRLTYICGRGFRISKATTEFT
jgi:hypothetical protein